MKNVFEVKRRQGESIESLLRRFKQGLLRGRVLIKVKEGQFYQREKSKGEKREKALRRKIVQEKKEYLRKIGKLKDIQEKYKSRSH